MYNSLQLNRKSEDILKKKVFVLEEVSLFAFSYFFVLIYSCDFFVATVQKLLHNLSHLDI